jgi:hypothetical protein
MQRTTHALVTFALCLIGGVLTACTSKPAAHASNRSSSTSSQSTKADDLQAAMDKLEASIQKPTAPFHGSFKKSTSDGFSYECEADISPDGITGQQIDNNPTTKIGDDVFPANTRTRQLNGTPFGSPNFQYAYGSIHAYFNGHIGDAQPGVKYVGDEQVGGYDARRYDFDLTGLDADIKKAMGAGNSLGLRQNTDYNVKGSAWIAKADGRMVKFSFDNIYTLSDGTNSDTHFDGAVTKK